VYFVSFFKSLYSLWFFILVFHFLTVLLSFFSVSSVSFVVYFFYFLISVFFLSVVNIFPSFLNLYVFSLCSLWFFNLVLSFLTILLFLSPFFSMSSVVKNKVLQGWVVVFFGVRIWLRIFSVSG